MMTGVTLHSHVYYKEIYARILHGAVSHMGLYPCGDVSSYTGLYPQSFGVWAGGYAEAGLAQRRFLPRPELLG